MKYVFLDLSGRYCVQIRDADPIFRVFTQKDAFLLLSEIDSRGNAPTEFEQKELVLV